MMMARQALLLIILLVFSQGIQAYAFGSPASFSKVSPVRNNPAKQAILEKALAALNRQYEGKGYRFQVSERWLPGRLLRIAPENITQVEPVGPVEPYMNFKVLVKNRQGGQKVQVQLAVEAERKLPVAIRRLRKGTVIEAGDFRVRWVSLSHDRGHLIGNIGRLEGQTLRRTLLPGQAVREDQVSGAYLIEAGDPVRLLFEQQGVVIELNGEARQNGAQDEEITIYSNETRRKYLGRVTGPGEAIWKKTLY